MYSDSDKYIIPTPQAKFNQIQHLNIIVIIHGTLRTDSNAIVSSKLC